MRRYLKPAIAYGGSIYLFFWSLGYLGVSFLWTLFFLALAAFVLPQGRGRLEDRFDVSLHSGLVAAIILGCFIAGAAASPAHYEGFNPETAGSGAGVSGGSGSVTPLADPATVRTPTEDPTPADRSPTPDGASAGEPADADPPDDEPVSVPTSSPTETATAATTTAGSGQKGEAPSTTSTRTPRPTTVDETPTTRTTTTTTAVPTTTHTPRGPSQGDQWTVTVTRVVDGDTLEARFPNGDVDTLRLLGVDTPETTYYRVSPDEFDGIPDSVAGNDHLYNWGQKASEFTADELDGETVRIQVDSRADRRGSYGRLLVYVYADGENFNRRLITEGYARMYDSSFSRRSDFRDAEATARRNEVGLWEFDAPSTPVPTTTEADGVGSGGSSGEYDCDDFDTWAQAQDVLEDDPSDPHRLDADDDGIACESLRSSTSESTPTETPEPSTETPTETPQSDDDSGFDIPSPPSDGDYDCGHFDTQEQAQYVLENTPDDPHRLDGDDDGEACESLP